MYSLHSIVLLGLVGFSAAKGLKDLNCDGTIWTVEQQKDAKAQARLYGDAPYGNGKFKPAYPKHFHNMGTGNRQSVFHTNVNLWEFPLTEAVWTRNASPGPYRIIMKNNYEILGATYKLPGKGDNVGRCLPQ